MEIRKTGFFVENENVEPKIADPALILTPLPPLGVKDYGVML